MDIVGLAMSMSQTKAMNAIGTAVLSNAIDMTESMGQGMANMIESAPSPSLESLVNPSVGKNIDFTV